MAAEASLNVDVQCGEGSISVPSGVFYNNEWHASVSGKTFPVTNPATEGNLCQIQEGDKADVDLAVTAARAAFEAWGSDDGTARSRLLNRVADALEARAKDFAALEAADNGKPCAVAGAVDIPLTVACFRYYAGWADKMLGQHIPVNDTTLAYTRHEPVGVVGAIIPWNFPLLMLAWKVAPCLATGCTMVLKPAEQTPMTALLFADVVKDILPKGVFNLVPGYGPTAGAALSNHMDVDKVAFTGSVEVGKIVMQAAARSNLKKCSLELGGKSPHIVCADADIDTAVNWGSMGIFFNHGQTCCAGSRIFVHEDIYDEYVAKFVAKAKSIKVGSPFDAACQQGPQVNKEQYEKILGYIKSGVDDGATLECGGTAPDGKGYFIQPTLFTNVREDMKICREEIFGPVAVAIKWKTIDEVVRMANDTVFGLAAAVQCRDIGTSFKIANKLKAGTVWINCYNLLDHRTPFGGFKQSGIGRELGKYALDLFTEVKTVRVQL